MKQQKSKRLNTENETFEKSRDIGLRKKLNPNDLKPFKALSKSHEDFLTAFYSQTPITSLHGWPGTGKTFIAMAASLSEVFDTATPYDKITIVRSAVEVRSIGFLPGTAEEKLEAYEAPYSAMLKELMSFNDPYTMAKQLGYVEFVPTTFLRGMTFNDQIVIVDECENMDYAELATVFTRMGSNCKMVFIGDDNQSDLGRSRQVSGFKKFRMVLEAMKKGNVALIDFKIDEIVRSPLIKDFLIAEAKVAG